MDEAEVIEKLRSFICEEILRRPDFVLTDDQPLITGGLIDSHSRVVLAVFLEDTFDVYIPDTEFTPQNMDTLSDIAKLVMLARA